MKFLLTVLMGIVVVLYWPGLFGNFEFDDSSHITGNNLVAITNLNASQLFQAWNSSPFDFPGSRPLSMVTFGINHVFSGYDPFWFKLTNLIIHLICGVAVYYLALMLCKSHKERVTSVNRLTEARVTALLVSALWLLAPINLSPVLYVVQRMTSLSTLFVLLSLISYMHGRTALSEGKFSFVSFICVPLFGGIGFLAKEIAALIPLYLLVIELTVFRLKITGYSAKLLPYSMWVLFIAMPLLFVGAYLLMHPEFIAGGYVTRPFSLEERVLTEARIIWFYIGLLFSPELDSLAFHYDGFSISTGFFEPFSTMLSWMGILLLILISVLISKQFPLVSFGLLFFLVGHILESTILPLELVFEHRNYLPVFGLIFPFAYYLIKFYYHSGYKILPSLIISIVIIYPATITTLRAGEWGDPDRFTILEATRHPESARANFKAGKLFVGKLSNSETPEKFYDFSKMFFDRAIQANERNADGLFGLIVLNLHMNRQPEIQWVYELKRRLKVFPFSPLNVTTGQFEFLVKWQMSGAYKLRHEYLVGIFEAALQNPIIDRYAKSGILNALRAYYQEVRDDHVTALKYARESVKYRPEQWHYRKKLIHLLVNANEIDAANHQINEWESNNAVNLYQNEISELRSWINSH